MKWIGAQIFDFDTYLRSVNEDSSADVMSCLFTAPSGKVSHSNFTAERGRTYTFGGDDANTTTIGRKDNSAASGGDFWISAGGATGSDRNGGDLRLRGGLGTGAGDPGDVQVYVAAPEGSGTAAQTSVEAAVFAHTGLTCNREFAITSNTDGLHSGDIVYFGGTTSMDVGQLYHYKSDGTWEKADANAVATCDGLLAIALGAASDTNGMLLRGMVTLDHDPGAVGDVLFVKTTAGAVTSTAPSGNNDIVRVVGYCLHASNGQIWFNPDSTFVEVTA